MVIASFAAGPLAANCYVLATEPGAECVIIDPGMDAAEPLATVLTEQRLRPAAVLLTHGHFDHLADAAAISREYEAGCWLHPADRAWLTDPLAALTPDFAPLVTDYLGGSPAAAPAGWLPIELSADGTTTAELAGMRFEFLAAAGHTPGATLFRTAYDGREGEHDLVFTGDVLFEGTIGRCDLPGGDRSTMERTLGSTVLSLPDEAVVLPGHGRQTTIGRERTTNPFLRSAGRT